jgi:hypothetical protein
MKQREKVAKIDLGVLFFLPYLRIVPMHLMILIPTFFGITPSILFLVLKTIADALFYVVAKKSLFKKA